MGIEKWNQKGGISKLYQLIDHPDITDITDITKGDVIGAVIGDVIGDVWGDLIQSILPPILHIWNLLSMVGYSKGA